MNISIYLPDDLKNRFESYVRVKGITKNAAVRNAVELLLKNEKKASWGSWMDDFRGDPTVKELDYYRSELREPDQNIF